MASRRNSSLGVNFAGRLLIGAVSLVVTPLYLKLLGPEAYGLVGGYLLLQTLLAFAGSGLADVANRAAARGGLAEASPVGNLRGYAWSCWLIGGIIWAGLTLASGPLAREWLQPEHLSAETVQQCLRSIAVLVALQTPFDFYVAVCLGSGRPVMANMLLGVTALTRAVVGVGLLMRDDVSVPGFFATQAMVLAAGVAVGAADFMRRLPQPRPASVLTPWLETWRMPAAMTGVALTSIAIGQLDRVVLSRELQLDDFGYYGVATVLANLLYFVIGPIQAAYYPEFSRLAHQDDSGTLSEVYHEACQRMAVLVMPVGAVLIFFGTDVVLLWTGRAEIASVLAPMLAFLVGSRLVGALNTLPYSLQFAHGWTSLVLGANLLALVVLAPGVVLLARANGGIGAAAGYFFLSLPFLLGITWIMHRRLLRGEGLAWLVRDTLPFAGAAFALAGVGRLVQPASLESAGRLVWLLGTSAVTLAGTVACHAPTRRAVLRRCSLQRAETRA